MKATKKMDLTLLAFVIFAIVVGFWMADANATKYTPPKPEQDQAQDQHQDQSQSQSAEQSLTNDNRNVVGSTANNHGNNTAIESKTEVYAAGASSGDSSSTCQKVRDIRLADGFLFGLRWDMTDKDCRRLDVADQAYARGDTYFGDTLTCTVPFVLDAFDSVGACKTALERNDVVEAIKSENARLRADRERLLQEREYDRSEVEACRSDLEKLDERCTK